jgi:hypothetical protein
LFLPGKVTEMVRVLEEIWARAAWGIWIGSINAKTIRIQNKRVSQVMKILEAALAKFILSKVSSLNIRIIQ